MKMWNGVLEMHVGNFDRVTDNGAAGHGQASGYGGLIVVRVMGVVVKPGIGGGPRV